MVKVFHNKDFINYYHKMMTEEITEISQSLLEKVANVETDNLDKAFELTNSIEQSWTKNEGVKPVEERLRSSSVGDVFIKEGQAYIVQDFGFQEIAVVPDK